MNSSKSLQIKIVETLRNIGTPLCIAEANRIESLPTLKRRFHFRKLNLSIPHLEELFDILDHEKEYKVNSISFSHNPIGDQGALIVANRLPHYIEEIGLVDCNITDVGARNILSSIQHLPDLDMLCLEKNNLSEDLKLEYQKFAAFNPGMMIVL